MANHAGSRDPARVGGYLVHDRSIWYADPNIAGDAKPLLKLSDLLAPSRLTEMGLDLPDGVLSKEKQLGPTMGHWAYMLAKYVRTYNIPPPMALLVARRALTPTYEGNQHLALALETAGTVQELLDPLKQFISLEAQRANMAFYLTLHQKPDETIQQFLTRYQATSYMISEDLTEPEWVREWGNRLDDRYQMVRSGGYGKLATHLSLDEDDDAFMAQGAAGGRMRARCTWPALIAFLADQDTIRTLAPSQALDAVAPAAVPKAKKSVAPNKRDKDEAKSYDKNPGKGKKPKRDEDDESDTKGKKPKGNGKGNGKRSEERTCYNCGKEGHIKPNCPDLKDTKSKSNAPEPKADKKRSADEKARPDAKKKADWSADAIEKKKRELRAQLAFIEELSEGSVGAYNVVLDNELVTMKGGQQVRACEVFVDRDGYVDEKPTDDEREFATDMNIFLTRVRPALGHGVDGERPALVGADGPPALAPSDDEDGDEGRGANAARADADEDRPPALVPSDNEATDDEGNEGVQRGLRVLRMKAGPPPLRAEPERPRVSLLCVVGSLDGNYIEVVLDSGSEVNLMPRTWAQKLGIAFEPWQANVSGVGQGQIIGVTKPLEFYLGDVTRSQVWYITNANIPEPLVHFNVTDQIAWRYKVLDENTISFGNRKMFRGGSDVFFPERLVVGGSLHRGEAEDATESGVQMLREMREMTLAVNVNVVDGKMVAHLATPPGSLRELPFNKWPAGQTPEQARRLITECFEIRGLKIERPLVEALPLMSAEELDLLGQWLVLGVENERLARASPFPVMLDRNMEPATLELDIEQFNHIAPIRRLNPQKLEVLQKSVSDMTERGITVKVPPGEKPELVLENVFTRTGVNELRHCLDPRIINSALPKSPTMRTDERQHFVGIGPKDVRHMAICDVSKAFWTVQLGEKTRRMLVFRGVDELYRWNRMPFGLEVAPSTFNRFIADVMADQGVQHRRMVDNFLVFNEDRLQFLRSLVKLWTVFNEHHIPIKPSSVSIFAEKVTFHGRDVYNNGTMTATETSIDKLVTIPVVDQNISAVRTLLGTAQWIAQYVPDMARVLAPFSEALKKSFDFAKSFDVAAYKGHLEVLQRHVRENICRLTLPDPAKPVIIDCDASDLHIGAAILQPVDASDWGKGYAVLALRSATLKGPQLDYAVYEKEMFSLISAVSYAREFVSGFELFARTDHKPLLGMHRKLLTDGLTARATRWLYALYSSPITLLYIEGSKNVLADTLSRWVVYHTPDGTLLKEAAPATTAAISNIMALTGRVQLMKDAQPPATLDAAGDLPLSLLTEAAGDAFIQTAIAKKLNRLPVGIDAVSAEDKKAAEAAVVPHLEKFKVGGKTGAAVTLFYRGEGDHFPRRVVPVSLRKTLWRLHHSSLVAGHPGTEGTLRAMSRTVWWPTMRKDVTLWTKACPRCQTAKPGGTTVDFERGDAAPASRPFEVVMVDMLEGLPETPRGAKVAAVFTDEATRFMVAVALPNRAATSVGRALLYNVALTFGFPSVLKSDEGTETANQLIKETMLMCGVTPVTTGPYAVHGVARNERTHLEIANALRALQAGEDWDLLLPIVAFALNSRVNRTTGATPFMAMFGRPVMSPYDVTLTAMALKELNQDDVPQLTLDEWVEELHRGAARRETRQRALSLQEAAAWNAKRGKGAHLAKPEIGSLMAVRAVSKKERVGPGKLESRWIAPFKVVAMSPNRLKLTLKYVPDESIVLERAAYDCKFYHTDEEADETLLLPVNTFEIEEIVEARGPSDDREYLVSWRNYPPEFNLWVPPENFDDNAKAAIKAADERWPPTDHLAEAAEPIPDRTGGAPDWVTALKRADIAEFLGVRSTKGGLQLEFSLAKEKKGAPSRRVAVKFLPAEILNAPEVQKMLAEHKH